jgi:hypothetical protein
MSTNASPHPDETRAQSVPPAEGDPVAVDAAPATERDPVVVPQDPSDLFPPPGLLHDELLPARAGDISFVKRVTLIVCGIVLIVAGIVGWLLPVMTGVPFWVAGLILLARASDRCRRLINWGERNLPTKARQILRWARDKTGIVKKPATPTTPSGSTS